jgi:hypothetical protein
MGDKKPTITPNGDEQPFGGNSEGEKKTVMVGIMAAMVEALLSYLTNDEGYVFNTNLQLKTRKKVDYKFKNQAFKHQKLGRMASFMKVNEKKITSAQLTIAGCSYIEVYFNDGQPPVEIRMASPVIGKLLESKSKAAKQFQRAAAAYVSFRKYETLTQSKREEILAQMSEKTRQNFEEIPEGMTLTSTIGAKAFGLEVGEPIRHVMIEQPAMIRETFRHLKAELSRKGVSMIDNSGDRQREVSREEYSEDTHLEVNALNLVSWFKTHVFACQRYCRPCQFAMGAQQSKKGCLKCGNPKRNLSLNSNTAHLPFIESNQTGLKTVGGWRIEMKSFIMSKKGWNALNDAAQGLMASVDALKIFMAQPVTIRKQMDGQTKKVKARLVPCWYEVPNASGNRMDRFGLVIETLHKGDL